MNPSRYRRLRARLTAARAGDGEAEGGFVLMYVLIVTMLVTVAVTGLVMTTTQAVKPTQDSVNRTLAYAGAQAGLQDAVAWMNANCPQTGTVCPAAIAGVTGRSLRSVNGVTTDALGTAANRNQAFSWKISTGYVQDKASNPTYRYVRVTSVGSAGGAWGSNGGYSGGRSVSLVADMTGTPSVLDYEYYSTYETNGSSAIGALNPARSIYLDCSTLSAASGALNFSCPTGGNTTATWTGATAATTAGAASAAYPSPAVCDKLFYDSAAFDGANGLGRASTQSAQSGLVTGADWKETGTVGTTAVARFVPCQVSFTSGQSFDGKVYTVDAPLVSNGTPGGTGPSFAAGLYTAWQLSSNPATNSQGGNGIRTDPYVGSPAVSATSRANPLTLANSFNPAPPSSACIFYGPTRVKLNGNGTATVTSPQTTSALRTGAASCYSTVNSAGQFTISYSASSNNVIYVRNNGSTFTTTGQRSTSTPAATDTAFWVTNGARTGTPDAATVAAPDTCSSTSTYTGSTANAACAWSGASTSAGSGYKADGGGWTTYTANSTSLNSCTSAATDRLLFECEFNNGSVGTSHDNYGIYRTRVKNDLATNSYSCGGSSFAPTTATAAQLTCLLNAELKVANSGGNATGTAPSGSGLHQYLATAGTPSVTTSTKAMPNATAPSAPITNDGFFTQQAGSAATETVTTTATTYTVNRETSSCSGVLLLGACTLGSWVWGGDVPQFQVTITQTSYSGVAGNPAVSYFPSMQDVTQYGTGTGGANGTSGPGDVYLEGTNTAPLSVLSEGDTVITGNLTTSGSGATLLDSLGDVRIYNPVSCKDQTAADITATTAGFCPNDLTGLYTGGLVSGSALSAAHPANQYVNLLGTPISTVSAALVAQGTSNSTGSFRTDNAARGASDGTLSVTGGIYQRHRGATGVQWEYLSTASVARASTGYKLALAYNDLQNVGLPYVPVFNGGAVSRYWNVVSVSTCTSVSSGVCS